MSLSRPGGRRLTRALRCAGSPDSHPPPLSSLSHFLFPLFSIFVIFVMVFFSFLVLAQFFFVTDKLILVGRVEGVESVDGGGNDVRPSGQSGQEYLIESLSPLACHASIVQNHLRISHIERRRLS